MGAIRMCGFYFYSESEQTLKCNSGEYYPIRMKIDSFGEIRKRIISEFLDLVILSVLYYQSDHVSGYDIIKYLHERFGFRASPGSVYSNLYALERQGLLKAWQIGKKRVYALTPEGRKTTKFNIDAKDRIGKFLSSILE